MVNGEQLRSGRIIGLPFTVHGLPNALRSALSAWLAVYLDIGRGGDLQSNLLRPANFNLRLFNNSVFE
jgi:hypothetical protein